MTFELMNIREKLERDGGRTFWRSLEELAESPEYLRSLESEFPKGSLSLPAPPATQIGRRDILKVMAASAALCGLSGCTKLPDEKILPYVKAPEEIVPGKPLFYATSMPDRGCAIGLLVETHNGRPTKIEGNPSHPASLGATNIFAQASVLTLWDPNRSQSVLHDGRISDFGSFTSAIRELASPNFGPRGSGLRILTGAISSPTFAAQMQSLLQRFPEAKWYAHEPFGSYNAKAGSRLALNRVVNTVYRFERADTIFSLDSDFIYSGPAAVRYGRDFMQRRTANPQNSMNRLYIVEPSLTNTGALADHRYPVRSRDVEKVARALAKGLGISIANADSPVPRQWMDAALRDLMSHRGSSIVIAGDDQPASVHALAHLINQRLENIGNTVYYTDTIEAGPETDSLTELTQEIDAGKVTALLIASCDPVLTAPADFDFAKTLQQVKTRIHVGLYADETAQLCQWHVPEAHFLEAWGDARTFDGTVGVTQPVIAPLYHGHSAQEVLAIFASDSQGDYERVRAYWRQQRANLPDKEFRNYWEAALHDGILPGTKYPELKLTPQPSGTLAATQNNGAQSGDSIELVFRPDPTVWDGRWASNAWLQELPKPITKLTWDNALMLSPAMAGRLGIGSEDVVEISAGGKTLEAPVWVMPGHADNSATLAAGYGRWSAGDVGNGSGVNAYQLRISNALSALDGVQFNKTGKKYPLASTQTQHVIAQSRPNDASDAEAFQRGLMRVATIEEFRRHPAFAQEKDPRIANGLSLVPPYTYEGYAWAMAIDLNRCIGCSACVIACYAENNIPTVGKHEVMAGRDMQWLRVDTYHRGTLANPETYFEPVPCMHCENAPCELVCPVGATVHSAEGLNEMVYNRCVGTRYCSNNCPYKVRRFNFRLYSDWNSPSLYGLRNPNVTVRSRGVMEKCTYCVQRINAAKITAEKEQRSVRDGEIRTACQQACPTDTIIFGNINDKGSLVSQRKSEARDYSLLAELNTRPRTTYQAKLTNPSPELGQVSGATAGREGR